MDLKDSRTLSSLMRAFAGETQAWARYAFAEECAREQKLECLARLFAYTAGQEKEHAEILWGCMQGAGAARAPMTADFPVDLALDPLGLLRQAVEHERLEADAVYPELAQLARQEGFPDVATRFEQLAAIEDAHARRFERLAALLEQNKLFRDEGQIQWICLNCGHIQNAPEAPGQCPVCAHAQGFFLRLEMSPFQ